MYAKRIEIEYYGPISQLEIDLPFDNDIPKPIVLVGENGSGKSILLSHIVNGLIEAKGYAYPSTPEVATGRVFKLRSPSYIKPGSEWSYARVDFELDFFIGELTISTVKKKQTQSSPNFTFKRANEVWNQMDSNNNNHLISNIRDLGESSIREIFTKNCVLYFPHNRFEEPAWLNEENLKAQAKYMNLEHIQGSTSRRMINYSSLHENQNWLFEVAYDMLVFDRHTEKTHIIDRDTNQINEIEEWKGFAGVSTDIYEVAMNVVRRAMKGGHRTTLGIGPRLNRTLSLMRDNKTLVPNIFQLSSGETSLLNLFLSILRDFNLSGAPFSSTNDVRGIVLVDEIDLHLHAIHQYEILPQLIQMFPKVQFVVTTHSPLFVLGMKKILGEDAFAIYQLPDGQQISAEDFTEFGNAYKAFRSSSRFSRDVRQAVEHAQRPILYVEGLTDIKYLRRAAQLLCHDTVLEGVDLLDGNGDDLKNTWKHVTALPESLVPRKVLVIRDCDYEGKNETNGKRHRLTIPKQDGHPLEKGIENLFSKTTLEKAIEFKPAFIDVIDAHKRMERGEVEKMPEQWAVNKDEKTNLCDWLCQNGTAEDFAHFEVILDLITELLGIQ